MISIFYYILFDQQFNNKMDIQNALQFCNQYLMMKALTLNQNRLSKQPKTNQQQQVILKKKKGRGLKFQNPTKKVKDQHGQAFKNQPQPTEKVKTRKRKFEGAVKKKQHDPETKNVKVEQQGYVPIQILLNQLTAKPQSNIKGEENFMSFGPSNTSNNYKYSYSSNYINSNMNANSNLYNPSLAFNSNERYEDAWMYRQSKNTNTTANQYSLSNIKQDYFSQSPIKNLFDKRTNGYYIPASRSRSPLDHSNSCSDLSVTSMSKSNIGRRKKGEKSFYLPQNTGSQQQNLQISRCTSTNKLLAKLERQLEQKNEQLDKSKIQETRFETRKVKKQTSIMKQLEDYSTIQLDNNVRQSLSFLSQIRGPPKPIPIRLERS